MKSYREVTRVRKAARQAKPDDAPKTRNVPNKRDTKKWCRGKVGVVHKLVVRPYDEAKLTDRDWHDHWLILHCSACGKELEQYTPFIPWLYWKRKKPAWVEEYMSKQSFDTRVARAVEDIAEIELKYRPKHAHVLRLVKVHVADMDRPRGGKTVGEKIELTAAFVFKKERAMLGPRPR